MNKYTVLVDGEEIYTTYAKNLKEMHKLITPQMKKILHYPYFWNLFFDRHNLPGTIIEKIIYFSKPHSYFVEHDNLDKIDDIETTKGYYFYGQMMMYCMEDLNHITAGSASDSDDLSSNDEETANSGDQNVALSEEKEEAAKEEEAEKATAETHSEASGSRVAKETKEDEEAEKATAETRSEASGSRVAKETKEDEDESVNSGDQNVALSKTEATKLAEKYIEFFVKKFMTYDVFRAAMMFPNPDMNRSFSTMSLKINDKPVSIVQAELEEAPKIIYCNIF